MPIIYRKTARGLAEIETRVYKLAPRLRSVLIMIDGKRSDEDLAQMLPQAGDALQALVQEDFIAEYARVGSGSTGSGAAAPAPAAAAPVPAAAAAPAAAPAAKTSTLAFEAMRKDLIRAFNDRVGPAGESMAMKMEKAANEAEFRALLPMALRLIATVQGRAAAESFSARVDAW